MHMQGSELIRWIRNLVLLGGLQEGENVSVGMFCEFDIHCWPTY